jgi:hypothetical protein
MLKRFSEQLQHYAEGVDNVLSFSKIALIFGMKHSGEVEALKFCVQGIFTVRSAGREGKIVGVWKGAE